MPTTSDGASKKAAIIENLRQLGLASVAPPASAPQLPERSVISTVEELDALPSGSIIRLKTSSGQALVGERQEDDLWHVAEEPHVTRWESGAFEGYFPAEVLYLPEAQELPLEAAALPLSATVLEELAASWEKLPVGPWSYHPQEPGWYEGRPLPAFLASGDGLAVNGKTEDFLLAARRARTLVPALVRELLELRALTEGK